MDEQLDYLWQTLAGFEAKRGTDPEELAHRVEEVRDAIRRLAGEPEPEDAAEVRSSSW